MARTRKRLLLKLGVASMVLLAILLATVWLNLPYVLTLITNQQLEKRGYPKSHVTISDANSKGLSIESAEIHGPGWSVHVKNSTAAFDIAKVVEKQEVDLVSLDQLYVKVTPDELEESEAPLTIETLTAIPAQKIDVRNGHFQLEVASGLIDLFWSGGLQWTGNETLVVTANRLQAQVTSPEGNTTLHLSPLQDPSGLLLFSLAKDGTRASLTLSLTGIQASGTDWTIEEAAVISQLEFHDLNLSSIDLVDHLVVLPRMTESIEGEVSVTANQISSKVVSLQWSALDISFAQPESPTGVSMNASLASGIVTVANETVEQLAVQLTSTGNLDTLITDAKIGFLFDGSEGAISINQTTEDLLTNRSLIGQYAVEPLEFRYSDIIGRYVPSFEDLSFSGSLSATGGYRYSPTAADATATIKLEDGSATLPSKKLTASGITAVLDLKSVTELTSTPSTSFLNIASTTLGDLEFSNTQLNFDFKDGNEMTINRGQTRLFEGFLILDPTTLNKDPLSLSTAIRFESLSLTEITENMAFFDGTMEGSISGYLPLGYNNEKFLTGEGHLSLTNNKPARLRYKTEGLLTQEPKKDVGFVDRLTNRIIGQLKLAPDKLVEDALSDLVINKLSIDLLSSDSPDTPIRIRISGDGKSGKTIVPMRLDTNINGTLEELFEFLLRINTIGD